MPTTKAASAYEPRTITGITDDWTKILTRNGNRAYLSLSSEEETAGGRYYLPSAESFDDPWCVKLDGSNDLVEIDGILADAAFVASTTGLIEARVMYDSTNTGDSQIISFARETGFEYIILGYDTNDKLVAECCHGYDKVQWTVTSDDAVEADGWHRVMLVHDGIRPTLYLNGALIPQTRTGDYQTKWFSSLTTFSLDNARLGAIDYGGNGYATDALKGMIDWVIVRDLTSGAKDTISEWFINDADQASSSSLTIYDQAGSNNGTVAGADSDHGIQQKSNGRVFTASTTTEWDVSAAGDASEISNTVWVKSDSGTISATVYETRRG